MVDEEGRFTPAAGADLQGQSVLEEGNATGKKTHKHSVPKLKSTKTFF